MSRQSSNNNLKNPAMFGERFMSGCVAYLSGNIMSSNRVNAKVEIYTCMPCGYCIHAKQLLDKKSVAYIEYAIDGDEQARRQMIQRANGRRSVPQIFINDRGIGGFWELRQLEVEGQLDGMLGAQVD